MSNLQGLYVITDEKYTPHEIIEKKVAVVLQSGAKIIQLRDKTNSDKVLEKTADKLQALCRKYKALFILNDRVDLAIKNKYDGLHVGESEYGKIKQIREDFKGVLGVSCYGDIYKAQEFEELGVDYVAFGSFFSSKTKPHSKVVQFETLYQAKMNLSIPFCAIGGITVDKVEQLRKAGVNMIAVIEDIWSSESIEEKVLRYNKMFTKKECT